MNPVEGIEGAVATIPISPMFARKKWMGTQEGQRSVAEGAAGACPP